MFCATNVDLHDSAGRLTGHTDIKNRMVCNPKVKRRLENENKLEESEKFIFS